AVERADELPHFLGPAAKGGPGDETDERQNHERSRRGRVRGRRLFPHASKPRAGEGLRKAAAKPDLSEGSRPQRKSAPRLNRRKRRCRQGTAGRGRASARATASRCEGRTAPRCESKRRPGARAEDVRLGASVKV